MNISRNNAIEDKAEFSDSYIHKTKVEGDSLKQTIRIFILAILLFCLLPIMAVELINGQLNHLDMGIIVIALLVLNPIFFAIVGWKIAFENKVKWLIPIMCVAIFFISAYLIYGMNEWFYVGEYLIIAYLSIFIHNFIKHLKQNKSLNDRIK